MADDQNRNRAQELKEARELKAIEAQRRDIAREMQGLTASQAYTRDSVSQAAALTDYARMLTEQMKEQAGIKKGKSEVDKSLLSISQQLQSTAQKVTSELGNEYKVQQQITRDKELQRKIQIEIANAQSSLEAERIAKAERISQLSLDEQRAQTLTQQLTAKISGNQSRLNELKKEGGHLNDEDISKLQESITVDNQRIDNLGKILESKQNELDVEKNSATESERKLATLNSQLDVIADIQGIRAAELETQRQITQATGVTGAVVGGIGGIMQRLGMRSGIFNQAMDDSKTAMEDLAGEGLKAGKTVSKMAVAMKGFGILTQAAAKVLKDPAIIVGSIVKGFFDLNEAGVEFGQITGGAADAMSGVNTEVSTSVDMLKTAASVTRELGLNAAAVFTPKQVGQISDLTTLLGLGEAAAGRLGLMMKTTGQSADQIAESVYQTVSALNQAGDSAVAPRQVLDDVLTASEDITLSLGNNPAKLTAAATAARKFGMTLSQVDNIASGLLDFESSIQNELEAQLLTGKNINMAKARELALNNDIAGLAAELESQGVSAVEFSKMNRIQQEATAKALGMNRQELSKSLLTQEAQANMTEEQLAAARGVGLEESKRISIQERIQKQLEKIQQAFAPVLEALVPIVEMALDLLNPFIYAAGFVGKLLASLLKLQPVMFALKGLVLATFGASFVKNIMMGGKSMKELTAVTKAYAVAQQAAGKGNKVDGRIKAARNMKNMTIGQTIAVKANTAAVFVADKIKKAYGRTTDFLSKKIAAASAAIKTNTIVEKLNGFATDIGTSIKKKAIAIQKAFTSSRIGGRIATMASTVAEKASAAAAFVSSAISKTRIGQLIAERAATIAKTAATYLGIGATQAANAAAATAAATGAAAGGGMAAFGAGLGAFGVAAAPAIPVILALGAAILMASPAIYALGTIITGLATVIGNVLMKALEMLPSIVYAVADGFSIMMGAVTLEKVAALALMGPALMSVAAGLAILSTSALAAIPGLAVLGTIALMGDNLLNAGNGVKLIADNINKMSEAIANLDLANLERLESLMETSALTMPAIAASGPAAAAAIQAVGGGASGGDDKVVTKIQELIDLVGSGQIVELKLDSDTITKQQMISLSKGK